MSGSTLPFPFNSAKGAEAVLGTSYVVASGKGGTGKTSFVAGVGAALARAGHKTLCIDADVGLRNLDLALGMSDRAVMNFADVIAGRCTLERAAAQHPVLSNLYLLTAPMARDALSITGEEMRAFLQQAKARFDFCIIDAPAGLGAGFRLAAAGADRAIIVTTTDTSSLRDAQHTVMELADYPLRSRHLVVNRVEKKLLRKLHRNIDDAIDTAGLPLIGIVPEDSAVRLAANREIPVILAEHRGAARAYENIARRLCGQRVPLMKI